METTWRVERAATKQREREQHELQQQEKNKRAAVRIQVSRTKVRSRTRGYPTTRIRTADQELPRPTCLSPSEEKAPANSSCRTSSGERNLFDVYLLKDYLSVCLSVLCLTVANSLIWKTLMYNMFVIKWVNYKSIRLDRIDRFQAHIHSKYYKRRDFWPQRWGYFWELR